MLGPLAGDQADPAGGGVEQDGLARLYPEGPAQKVLRSHAFQHHRGCLLIADAIRQRYQAIRLDQARLGVTADWPRIGNPFTDFDLGDPVADRLDHARTFLPRRERQGRRRIEPGTEVDIDEIQSDCCLPQADLARPRLADLDLFEAQRLGTADLMDSYHACHCFLPVQPARRVPCMTCLPKCRAW